MEHRCNIEFCYTLGTYVTDTLKMHRTGQGDESLFRTGEVTADSSGQENSESEIQLYRMKEAWGKSVDRQVTTHQLSDMQIILIENLKMKKDCASDVYRTDTRKQKSLPANVQC